MFNAIKFNASRRHMTSVLGVLLFAVVMFLLPLSAPAQCASTWDATGEWDRPDLLIPMGTVELVMDAGGTSFKGKILNVDTSGTLVGTRNGTREYSFAGAWRGKFGDGGVELVIQQAGSQVTGQLNINSVIYVIKGGSGDANNTLRFLVARPGYGGLPDQAIGTGELVMDAGGRSFKGKILNVDTSGTLIAR